jgi:hypothetical protein
MNFGEISPRALGRYDADKPIWRIALAKLENFLNHKLGGAQFFPGTQYVGNTKTAGNKIRLESITYTISQNYILEVGDRYFRFFSSVAGVPGQVIVNASTPIDAYTSFLAHFDGTNGQTNYTADTGQIVSFFGTSRLDTSLKVFGSSAVILDSYGNSYLSIPHNDNFEFGTGDLTIETRWMLNSSANLDSPIYVKWDQATNAGLVILYSTSAGGLYLGINSYTSASKVWTWAPTLNTYYHLAIIRVSGVWHFCVNGVEIGSSYSNATGLTANSQPVLIGAIHYHDGINPDFRSTPGSHYDEYRVSKGIARWTSFPFTPPTVAYGGAADWVTSHGYNVGDYVTQSGTVYICLVAHTSGTFATDLAAGDWTAQSALEVVTPYALGDVFKIQFAGKQDVTYCVCVGYRPYKLSRLSATSFTMVAVNFVRGPFLPANGTSTTITPSAATGSITLTASSSIFKNGHVGALFRIDSDATHGACVKITAVTSGTVATGDVQIEPDGTTGNIGGTGAYTTWFEGAFSDVQGWPISVVFHEQRIVYGKAGGYFYASASNVYDNFDSRTTNDSDAYSYQIASDTTADCRWLSSNSTLQIGTTAGTFTAQGSTGGVGITPTSISVTPDTDYSVCAIPPRKVSSYLYYLDGNTYTLRQMVFDLSISKQRAEDMTALADHILRDGSGATQIARQRSPNDRIWCIRSDGQLAVLTRDVEQGIMAWCRRIAGSSAVGAGLFESVAILSVDGGDDQIWVSVQRNINGSVVRWIEIFTSEYFTNYYDPVRVDASLSYGSQGAISGATQANPVVITSPGHGFSTNDIIVISGVVGMTNLNTNSYKLLVLSSSTYELHTNTADNMDSTIKLLLHMDGTTTTFVDYSMSPHAMTANGGVTQSTTQSKFGGKSCYCPGNVNTDYISTPNSTDYDFGSGDFEISGFFYFTNVGSGLDQILVSKHTHVTAVPPVSSNLSWHFSWSGNSLFFFYSTDNVYGNIQNKQVLWTPTQNTWYYLRCSRVGNNLRFFVNGVQQGANQDMTGVTLYTANTILRIGADQDGAFFGYIDEVMVKKGAGTSANFTPPTAPFFQTVDGTSFSPYISGGNAVKTATVFSGLSYLEGEQVSVMADGLYSGLYTVSSGSITLPTPAAFVHAGLPYTGKVQLLPLGDGSQKGTGQTMTRKIYLAALRLYKTLGGQIGNVDMYGNVTGLLDIPYPTAAGAQPFTGDITDLIPDSDWNKYSSFLIQQTKPLPMHILSIIIHSDEAER